PPRAEPHSRRARVGVSVGRVGERCWAGAVAICTTMVYDGGMAAKKPLRRSISLPPQVANQVERIAKRRRLSENRVLVELIEEGIAAAEQREKDFFRLAEKFRAAQDAEEIKRLG